MTATAARLSYLATAHYQVRYCPSCAQATKARITFGNYQAKLRNEPGSTQLHVSLRHSQRQSLDYLAALWGEGGHGQILTTADVVRRALRVAAKAEAKRIATYN